MNPRTDLAFFSTLVKSGSLTAAAREYDVTPSAVSKWLAQLEARLGVRLIARNTRRISLTNEGEVYLAEGRRILAEIDDLERTVASSRAAPVGLLKVNATLGFGRSFIAPAVSEFATQYPELEIQLLLSSRPLSLVEGEVDLQIRFGEPPDSRVNARRIAGHRRRIVAAPAYLERHGRPQVPQDLVGHNCLIVRQDDVAYGQWHFTKGRKTQTVKVRGTLSSNDGATALLWARNGHGILMRSEWDTAALVRSGALEVLLDDYALPPADIYAVYAQKQNLAAKVRVFVDFLGGSLRRGQRQGPGVVVTAPALASRRRMLRAASGASIIGRAPRVARQSGAGRSGLDDHGYFSTIQRPTRRAAGSAEDCRGPGQGRRKECGEERRKEHRYASPRGGRTLPALPPFA